MAAAKRIALLGDPVEWHGQEVREVFLRRPKAGLIISLGEPRFVTGTKEAMYYVERDDVVGSYLDALLSLDGEKPIEGGAAHFLRLVDMVDGLQIKDALFGFFTEALARISAAKAISSSSTSGN